MVKQTGFLWGQDDKGDPDMIRMPAGGKGKGEVLEGEVAGLER